MRAFLDYLSGGNPASELTREIERSIDDVKSNQIWEKEYMEFMDYWDTVRRDAHSEGYDEGHEEGRVSVAKKMLAAGENLEKISEYTDLSIEEIISIKDELCN